MSSTQYYSLSDRKKADLRKSKKKLLLICWILMVVSGACMVVGAKYYFALQGLHEKIQGIQELSAIKDAELSILRAMNPYQYKYSQILDSSESTRDLMPGWVARIYQAPKNLSEINSMLDMGAFVLDESKFTLASHESYGLDSPSNALYRLNGLIPTTMSGRFQIGVRLSFSTKDKRRESLPNQQASCFARVDVNNKRVIERKIKFLAGRKDHQVLTGDVIVKKGINPISALLYCDDNSLYGGNDVQISMTFRDPGSNTFKTSSDSVFHLYKHSRS